MLLWKELTGHHWGRGRCCSGKWWLFWATNCRGNHRGVRLHFSLSLVHSFVSFLSESHSSVTPLGKKQQVAGWGCLCVVLGRTEVVRGGQKSCISLSWTSPAGWWLSLNVTRTVLETGTWDLSNKLSSSPGHSLSKCLAAKLWIPGRVPTLALLFCCYKGCVLWVKSLSNQLPSEELRVL